MGWFKDFKSEMKEAVEEGRAEARAELAQEEEEKRGPFEAAKAAYEQTSPREAFEVALGAPYRELFLNSLYDAKQGDHPAYGLCLYRLPESKKQEFATYIDRDFGVVSEATLIEAVLVTEAALYSRMFDHAYTQEIESETRTDLSNKELKEKIDRAAATRDVIQYIGAKTENFDDSRRAPSTSKESFKKFREKMHLYCNMLQVNVPEMTRLDQDLIAVWTARISYMVAGAVGLGYIPQSDAEFYMTEVFAMGVPLFASWQEYSDAFNRGEKADKTNNVLGLKILASTTKSLLESEQSPWNFIPYPAFKE